jgi:peptide/nickel transport system substrate-binding protein
LKYLLTVCALAAVVFAAGCRRQDTEYVTVALSEPFSGFDTLTSVNSDAAAERVKNLIFNSLVKKSETFDYIGEMASEITASDDGKTIRFALRDNIKFHNGKQFTSADVKYTFDALMASKGYKRFAFFDTVDKKSVPHILSINTPDPLTVEFNIASASLKSQLLSNLVAIPIVAEGTVEQLATFPIGSGPFKFVSFDESQNTVEFEAFEEYWEGSPSVKKLRVKTLQDASGLQSELQTGGVDIAPMPSNLPPDSLNALKGSNKLNVEQFDGSNIQYIGLNTQSAPLNNVKIRQAIGYAIDREKIIKELLSGQGKIAHSILPEGSWAYTPGNQYTYDPERARQLIAEAGYKNEPIKFKYAAGSAAVNSYAQAIHSSLMAVGLNVQIETLDSQTLRTQLAQGQFQLNTGVWVGGNQDPLFLKDLFTTAKIPGEGVSCCNRSRYSNPEVDKLLETATAEVDQERAKQLYQQAWEIISSELPLYPLWYPANMVVANKRIGNIKINASGDWSFIKDITVTN